MKVSKFIPKNERRKEEKDKTSHLLLRLFSSEYEECTYLLAKPQNEDQVSCLADSHFAQGGRARNFCKLLGRLYREKAM